MFGYRTGMTIRYALTVHGPELGIDPVTGRTIPAGEAAPEPTRWAPRVSPWNGSIRTAEDPEVVAERLKRDRIARAVKSNEAGVSQDVQSDLLDRMISRRQAIAEGAKSTPPDDGWLSRTDDSTTRHR